MRFVAFGLTVLSLLIGAAAADDAVGKLVEQVRSVGPKGEKHQAASEAAKQLQQQKIDALPAVLAGLDDANPIAANWLRGVAESIAARHVASGAKLPVTSLEQFLGDTKHSPRGRRLAYELIASVDPGAEQRLIPPLQTDPSLELRYDAIRLAIDQAANLEKQGETVEALAEYRQAFVNARDINQTKELAKKLEALGDQVDMRRRLGFIAKWQLCGTFDNAGDKAWEVAYPPEAKVDLAATFADARAPQKWVEYTTTDPFGVVDLNAAIGKHKGAIAYAYAEFLSDRDQQAEVRLGCINANKVWVNGELATANRVYHTGMEIDQYVGPAKLRKGKNQILVRIGQNEQTEDWAQDWKFQLRVCDALGGPILSTDDL